MSDKNVRDRILARCWEIANLPPDRTRGNYNMQLKALELIWQLTRNDPFDVKPPAPSAAASAPKAAPAVANSPEKVDRSWMDAVPPNAKPN
jgi:hypothetical protein